MKTFTPIFLIAICLVLYARVFYTNGYSAGQIDALKGHQEYKFDTLKKEIIIKRQQ